MVRHTTNRLGRINRKATKSHSSFPTDSSKAVVLSQFLFVCASVVLYVAFVLSLYISPLSFLGVLGKLCIVIAAFLE